MGRRLRGARGRGLEAMSACTPLPSIDFCGMSGILRTRRLGRSVGYKGLLHEASRGDRMATEGDGSQWQAATLQIKSLGF